MVDGQNETCPGVLRLFYWPVRSVSGFEQKDLLSPFRAKLIPATGSSDNKQQNGSLLAWRGPVFSDFPLYLLLLCLWIDLMFAHGDSLWRLCWHESLQVLSVSPQSTLSSRWRSTWYGCQRFAFWGPRRGKGWSGPACWVPPPPKEKSSRFWTLTAKPMSTGFLHCWVRTHTSASSCPRFGADARFSQTKDLGFLLLPPPCTDITQREKKQLMSTTSFHFQTEHLNIALTHPNVLFERLFACLNKKQDFSSPLGHHISIHCTHLHIHRHQHNYICRPGVGEGVGVFWVGRLSLIGQMYWHVKCRWNNILLHIRCSATSAWSPGCLTLSEA